MIAYTSREAYHAIPLKTKESDCNIIFSVVKNHCDAGGHGLSMQEIKQIVKRLHGRDMETGLISARFADLKAANRLERLETTRKCHVSDASIHPIVLRRRQLGMFA